MPRLTVSSPQVVAEVIDGEAIILDLRAGSYFATEGVGAVVWAAAVDGFASEQIVASATSLYGGNAGVEVSALLDALVAADLLAVEDGESQSGQIEWPVEYAAPTLEKHDDLQDMMQLDPIHDTDVSGWPMPAPDRRQ